MKKSISILTAICLVLSLSAFSYPGPTDENETVQAFFKTDFANASSVNWTEKDGLYFADFTSDNTQMSAAYDENGTLLGTSRIISPSEVPAGLLKRAEGNFRGGKSASRVVELTFKGQVSYYFTIITDKFAIKCVADADGVITEDSRVKIQK